jgi:uncharacterized protein YjiS (DUF1127 family)
MNASTSTTNLDFSEPRSMSRAASGYAAPPAAASESHGGLGRWLADRAAALVAWPKEQAVIHELQTMTDRELADIGLARGDILHVFDRAYVRRLTGSGQRNRFAA